MEMLTTLRPLQIALIPIVLLFVCEVSVPKNENEIKTVFWDVAPLSVVVVCR